MAVPASCERIVFGGDFYDQVRFGLLTSRPVPVASVRGLAYPAIPESEIG